MADSDLSALERSILTQDVRRERDGDEGARAYDSGDSDLDDFESVQPPPSSGPPGAPPLNPRGHNTGPKGVRQDYLEAKRLLRVRREVEALRRIQRESAAAGAGISRYELQIFAGSAQEAEAAEQTYSLRGEPGSDEEEEDGRQPAAAAARRAPAAAAPAGSDEESGDEDAFADYARQRMAALQLTRRQFGRVQEVSRAEYVAAVDAEPPDVAVVVHLYEPFVPACGRLNNCLAYLARRHPAIKFLRIVASRAKPDYDPVALPTLIVYRGGAVVEALVQLAAPERLGKWFTPAHVEAELVRLGALAAGDTDAAAAPAFDPELADILAAQRRAAADAAQ